MSKGRVEPYGEEDNTLGTQSRTLRTILNAMLCLVLLSSLLLFNACSKEEQELIPGDRNTLQHTLTYTAGDNGSIDGLTSQKVGQGNDGKPVIAVPVENYSFVGWSDGLTTANRTDHSVKEDLAVSAQFTVVQRSLVYSAGEHGSIDGPDSQMVDQHGDANLVRGVPATGYHFVNWSDGVTTASRTDSDVTADLAVTANFNLNQYTLSYSVGKNGSLVGDSLQTVEHGGDASMVTAVAAENHHFVNWSDGVSTTSRTDRNVTADITIRANFAIDQYSLVYTTGKNGSITGAMTQQVDCGGCGSTVTAAPAAGYHFVAWSDGTTTASHTKPDVTADLAVTAIFARNIYTLTYAAGENGSIDGVALQNVEHGNTASTVTAVAEQGYHFVTWSDGVSTAHRTDSEVTGNVLVKAAFEIDTYTIGGVVSGLAEGSQLTLRHSNGETLKIIVDGDFNFSSELVDASTYEVSVLTQPVAPNQICTVAGGTGTIAGEDVNDIIVTCAPVSYTLSGTVFGLPDGDQVVLRSNETDTLVVTSNGPFTFATPLDDGNEYEIEVYKQPKKLNWVCKAEKASGTLTGMDITDVVVDCSVKVVLEAEAGIRKVNLNWNRQDFDEVTFNLCHAKEDISAGGFDRCQELEGGVLQTKINDPLTALQLSNDVPYWFQLEARYATGRQTLSEVVMAIPYGGLNDSGVDWCANDIINLSTDGTRLQKEQSCELLTLTFPGQDALHGRDASGRSRKLDKKGSGSSGFDFTKLCRSGEVAGEQKCPPNPSPGDGFDTWACTRDNVTGLTWEVKTDSGLRGKNNNYAWYNPDGNVNGGESGMKNGGKCMNSACDTQAYIQAINDLELCGANDWRLPTKRELLSIVDNGRFNPSVDSRFFPNTLSYYYWSSLPNPDQEDSAWQVYFLYGEALPNIKSQANHVRLVHGRTVTFGLDNP